MKNFGIHVFYFMRFYKLYIPLENTYFHLCDCRVALLSPLPEIKTKDGCSSSGRIRRTFSITIVPLVQNTCNGLFGVILEKKRIEF